MIRRSPWMHRDFLPGPEPRESLAWTSRSRAGPGMTTFYLCNDGLRDFFIIPRGTARLRIVASTRQPADDDHVVMKRTRQERLWRLGNTLMTLPFVWRWWLSHKFTGWRTLYVWIEVES